MKLIEVAKFTTRSEAALAAAALRASGVPATMFDDSPGGSAYNFPFSGDGFRVMAPADWGERARAALADIKAAAPTGEAD
jgi:hypothetical protein